MCEAKEFMCGKHAIKRVQDLNSNVVSGSTTGRSCGKIAQVLIAFSFTSGQTEGLKWCGFGWVNKSMSSFFLTESAKKL